MDKKRISVWILIIGFLIFAVSLLADSLRIGFDPAVFGPAQQTGVVVGLVIALSGLVLYLRSKKPKSG